MRDSEPPCSVRDSELSFSTESSSSSGPPCPAQGSGDGDASEAGDPHYGAELQVGDIVEARDKRGFWCVAKVIGVVSRPPDGSHPPVAGSQPSPMDVLPLSDPPTDGASTLVSTEGQHDAPNPPPEVRSLRVHFRGFKASQDETIPVGVGRFRPFEEVAEDEEAQAARRAAARKKQRTSEPAPAASAAVPSTVSRPEPTVPLVRRSRADKRAARRTGGRCGGPKPHGRLCASPSTRDDPLC